MTRGHSLEQDLRLLINNPKYSDIEILCGDEKKLYGCRAILAARSEVFNSLLYNGMKESYENQVSFPDINSSGMEIILEYIYTGSVNEKSLTKDNIIEAFYVADYFQLSDLQDFIMKTFKRNKDYTKNYSPELLSKVVNIMPLSDDNILLNLLVEAVATIHLNSIEFGRLSIAALQHLLSCTYEKEKPFATPEYEVFRYSAILAAKQVSNDAHKTFMELLPVLEHLENSIKVENKLVTENQEVAKELEPLTKFIDFRRIKGQTFVDIIEPLGVIPIEIILNVYRHKTKSNNSDLNDIRGIPIYKIKESDLVWDESACGFGLVIEDDGKVVQGLNNFTYYQYRSIRGKMAFDKNGIFEWDVIIEKKSKYSWVGICALENFDYETNAEIQSSGWVLRSTGNCWNSGKCINYCPSFGDDTVITVHLNMNKRTLAFTVNGTKYPEVPGWNNLPSRLYPVVSLSHTSCIRIRPH
jgi:hypothetical protein